MAVGVRLRPSRPPAPRRTISFSLSMTSKDRSGRTRTTIMWIELVPMSMAAIRMRWRDQRPGWRGTCLLHQRYILPVRPDPPHPTMNRSLPLVRLLDRRSRALRRQLAAAIAGKDAGVHQARVASRRLREALPVLTEGLHQTKAGKARRKIRRLTEALGTVRELDVTLHLIDELGERPAVPRAALAEVRALVIEERERRRVVMLKRLEERRHRQARAPAGRGAAGRRRAAPAAHGWRAALAVRIARRARRLEKAIDAGRPDLRARGAAPGAHRGQEAPLRAGDRRRERRGAVPRRGPHDQAGPGNARPSARSADPAAPRRRGRRRAAASPQHAGRRARRSVADDRRRVPSPARTVRGVAGAAARGGRSGASRHPGASHGAPAIGAAGEDDAAGAAPAHGPLNGE